MNKRGRRRRLKKSRVAVKTPGGRTVYHYRHKKHSVAKCAKCGSPLNATPTGPRSVIAKLPKSQRRPNRPYGGNLCPSCLRELMISKVIEEGMSLLAS
ncbi:MAG: 50S ribosomal protein L34e [Candidatus Korarchaeota archaeon]|nr:50S ribosomal protein L34e [Candidatus Korarchaeota archaeon]